MIRALLPFILLLSLSQSAIAADTDQTTSPETTPDESASGSTGQSGKKGSDTEEEEPDCD